MKTISNLDSVRAFAILTIVLSHVSNWVPQTPPNIAFVLYAGQFGVELFFALSGYLIGRSFLNEYFKHRSVNIAHFLAKRATRIVPPYLIILIPYSLGSYFLEGEKFRTEYFFLIQNYLYKIPYFFASWALCIEAHFYIILPFLYLFLDRFIFKLGKPLSIIIVAIICLSPLIGRAVVLDNVVAPMPWGFYLTATHLHYDAIAYGVLAAYISHKRFSILNKLNGITTLFACVLLAVSAISIHLPKYQLEYEFAPAIVGLLSAMAILCLAEGPQYNFSSNSVVKLLAKTSFAIYLAHGIALHAVNAGLKYLVFLDSTPLRFLLMTTASIASGLLFYGLVEKPLNTKRDVLLAKFFPIKV
ncbi:MAG: acyltransferase [Synechococcus sp.]|nr:acyltransferase [Synechococcus sp.]